MIQTLRARREDQWVKLRPASLYHKVDGLVARGLAEVVGTEQDGNRPPRTTYRLTDAGASSSSRGSAPPSPSSRTPTSHSPSPSASSRPSARNARRACSPSASPSSTSTSPRCATASSRGATRARNASGCSPTSTASPL
nr:helix-turn-helix transcriptional regulator [Dermacoccus nishinomiyaensis]